MEMYLLKSAACLAICFAFYKIFLGRSPYAHLKTILFTGGFDRCDPDPLHYVYQLCGNCSGRCCCREFGKPGFHKFDRGADSYKLSVHSIVVYLRFGSAVLRGKIWSAIYSEMIQKIRKNPHHRDQNIFHVLLN